MTKESKKGWNPTWKRLAGAFRNAIPVFILFLALNLFLGVCRKKGCTSEGIDRASREEERHHAPHSCSCNNVSPSKSPPGYTAPHRNKNVPRYRRRKTRKRRRQNNQTLRQQKTTLPTEKTSTTDTEKCFPRRTSNQWSLHPTRRRTLSGAGEFYVPPVASQSCSTLHNDAHREGTVFITATVRAEKEGGGTSEPFNGRTMKRAETGCGTKEKQAQENRKTKSRKKRAGRIFQ